MPKVIHKEYIPLATLILLTIISVLALTPLHTSAEDGSSNATDSASVDIGVNVGLACTLSGSNTSHAITLNNGNYNDNITGTTLHTICNGSGNYNIYAIGYTNNTDGNNTMHFAGSSNTAYDIPTGTTLDGTTSNWAMKLSNNVGNTATIENGYSSFNVIPSTSTLVASYNATSSNQTTDSTLQTTYGVSISPNQPAGTYTGQVKYTMGYTPYIPPKYIQDYDAATCKEEASDDNVTVVDRRDGNDYTVRYINGACWMTQNLRFLGNTGSAAGKMTLTSDTSNGATTTIDLYSLASAKNTTNSSLGAYGNHCNTIIGYNYACVYNSGDTNKGVWYNYNAVTAGNIKTDSNKTVVSVDGPSICPASWHLPTGAAHIATSEFYKLFQARTVNNWTTASLYLIAFDAVAGGYYFDGSLKNMTYGYWWSDATVGASDRYYLGYNSDNRQSMSSNFSRTLGLFVRCVRTS